MFNQIVWSGSGDCGRCFAFFPTCKQTYHAQATGKEWQRGGQRSGNDVVKIGYREVMEGQVDGGKRTVPVVEVCVVIWAVAPNIEELAVGRE